MNSSVLFLCKHNSSRSQMAEAFLRKHAGDRFEVASAGLTPTEIHPFAVRVMNEVGIDLSGHHAKGVKEFLRSKTSPGHAIIVCKVAEEDCPKIFPGVMSILRWSFDDPTEAMGSEEERLDVFRRVRDQIEERITQWLLETES